MKGFCKKIIKVNLSSKEITQEPLDNTAAQHFIGGAGLAAYYYHHFLNTQQEPPGSLEPNNPLYILTGALTGLPAIAPHEQASAVDHHLPTSGENQMLEDILEHTSNSQDTTASSSQENQINLSTSSLTTLISD